MGLPRGGWGALLFRMESSSTLAWRMRMWHMRLESSKVLEHYIQEQGAHSFLASLPPVARLKIDALGRVAVPVVLHAVEWTRCGIPSGLWPALFRRK